MNERAMFPIFRKENFHYLDSAATSQKPAEVIKVLKDYYENGNGNPGRGSHQLAIDALKLVNQCRDKVRDFIGAKSSEEIIFTKNTTEGINLVADSYGLNFLEKGDEILLAISNHHANIVPWQRVAQKTGAKLQYIYLDQRGQLDMVDFEKKLSEKTKLVSISAVVNVTGVIQPFQRVIKLAKEKGAVTLLDAAQSIAHFPHHVNEWEVDFMTFSAHKIYGAMGTGVLYGTKKLLTKIPPFLAGGDMIDEVNEQTTTFADLPNKFEAGTKDAAGIASLAAAIDFIEKVGYDRINQVEDRLLSIAVERLRETGIVEIYHQDDIDKVGVIAFNVRGVHSHDVSFILDGEGVMVRSGHHCAQPLMKYLKVPSCCRISFGIYNELEDIDALIRGIQKVKEVFQP